MVKSCQIPSRGYGFLVVSPDTPGPSQAVRLLVACFRSPAAAMDKAPWKMQRCCNQRIWPQKWNKIGMFAKKKYGLMCFFCVSENGVLYCTPYPLVMSK